MCTAWEATRHGAEVREAAQNYTVISLCQRLLREVAELGVLVTWVKVRVVTRTG
eukprot:SAG22_NODE_8652_length_639_cov_1.146296_1_plen_54_part_00